jgi:hypothetical protein
MTIAFRSVATLAAASSGSVTAPTPASTVSGDIIIIWTLQRHSSSSSSNSASLSGGSAAIFTQLLGYNTGITGAGQHQFAVWIGRRGGTYTAPSVDYTTGGLGNFVNSAAFSDSNPVPSGDYWEDLTQSGPSAVSPGGGGVITTTAADRMAVQLITVADNNAVGAISGGTPSGWAGDLQQSSSGNDGSLSIEYVAAPTAGNVTGPTRTTSDEWHSFLFALFGASSAATGTLAGADGADAASFAGDVIVQGTIAGTDGADIAAFSGDVIVQGTLSGTDGADGAAFTGTVGDVAITGTLDATDGADDASLTGTTDQPVRTDRGGDGFSARTKAQRKARYVRNRHFVIKRPEPEQPGPNEEPRKVTKAIVREAVAQLPGWWGTLAQARQVVPQTIPVMVLPEVRQPSAEYEQLVAATRAYIEQAIRAYEAAEQDEEDDIELLLMAA